MSDIWSECEGWFEPQTVKGKLFRVVESQEQVATNGLVDDLQEQQILEDLLESTKPLTAHQAQSHHYLLSTPFRYPPLPHGSRFGVKTEPSLFYGSLKTETALAETAYYRLLFWSGMSTAPNHKLTTQHNMFQANYGTGNGIKLQDMPFAQYQKRLTHPNSYSDTQPLGTAMRRAGVEACEFVSARDPQQGINIALFVPAALSSKKPLSQSFYLCETDSDSVTFLSKTDRKTYSYSNHDLRFYTAR